MNWNWIAEYFGPALFGAAAGFIRAMRLGLPARRAIIESLTAFVLCVAAGSGMRHWFPVPLEVIFGLCGLVGLSASVVVQGVERLWDAAFDRAESVISGGVPSGDDDPPTAG